ncbi:unnamed protein product, partial [Didymodactylos carnosus]
REHNHLLDSEDLEIKQFRQGLKERVINDTSPISKIYDEEIRKTNLSSDVLASPPLAHEIQPGLCYARCKLTPTLTTSFAFDIPDCYQSTSTGEKLLFSDSLVRRRERMLLFGSTKQLQVLFDSSTVLLDGTFSATPPFFSQVFTLHGLKFGYNNTIYMFFIIKIRFLIPLAMDRLFKPEIIISDFETGLIPAVAADFPETKHRGCFFHYNQSIYRRIQTSGLGSAYSQDEEIRSGCHKLMALALLPP